MDQFTGYHHTNFDSIGINILEYGIDLLLQEICCGLLYGSYSGGVLCRQRSDNTHGINTMHGHCFQISLNPGASAAIAAGDG